MIDRLQSFTIEDRPESDPRVAPIDSDAATATIKAISSETARRIIACLHEEPKPPSRIASTVGTSIANVNYHLTKLSQAGLITEVDTWYSEKGKEMSVYAPTDDPLVFTGTAARDETVRSILSQVGAAIILLLASSVVVQWYVSDVLLSAESSGPLRKATAAGSIEGIGLTPIPPGVLFFTGGTFVLTIVLIGWYLVPRGR